VSPGTFALSIQVIFSAKRISHIPFVSRSKVTENFKHGIKISKWQRKTKDQLIREFLINLSIT
jgi:hypothetical protein